MTGLAVLDTSTATREEWLSARKLGSSDAAAIVGLNPYRTRFAVFMDKIGESEPLEETDPMYFGTLLEPVIAQEFSRRSGLRVQKDNRLMAHPTYEWMTATLDYLVYEGDEVGALEIKNTSQWNAISWEDGAPDAAHIQLMHQLAVTGLNFGYIAVLIGGNRLEYRRFDRDEDIIASLTQLESEFWSLVEKRQPPELSTGDGDLLAALYPVSNANEIPLPAPCQDAIVRFMEAQDKIKFWESAKELAANEIKQALGENERGAVGPYIATWKTQSRKEHVVKASTFRKFTIKEVNTDGNE